MCRRHAILIVSPAKTGPKHPKDTPGTTISLKRKRPSTNISTNIRWMVRGCMCKNPESWPYFGWQVVDVMHERNYWTDDGLGEMYCNCDDGFANP